MGILGVSGWVSQHVIDGYLMETKQAGEGGRLVCYTGTKRGQSRKPLCEEEKKEDRYSKRRSLAKPTVNVC